MHKYVMLTLFVLSSVVGLAYSFVAVAGGEGEEHAEPPKENELRIVASNWKFDQETYTVEQGATLTVNLVNKQGIHGAAIPELGIDVKEGEPQEVTFDKPGTYNIECSVACGQGHAEMRSKLVVQ